MMQLNVQEVQEEEDDEIEYMPPRAQGEPSIQFSLVWKRS
jgi:hypothetical protein